VRRLPQFFAERECEHGPTFAPDDLHYLRKPIGEGDGLPAQIPEFAASKGMLGCSLCERLQRTQEWKSK
jgi:hypothetical protein